MEINAVLVKRCKNNDYEAFNLLFSRFEKMLYKICYSYCHDKQVALDIMQEVYIKVFKSIDTFDESRPLAPWLKKITVNTCLNCKRTESRHMHLPLYSENKDDASLIDIIASDVDVEEIAINRYNTDVIIKEIKNLPDIYRIALTLRYLEEMSYAEMADILDLPLGTVKSHVSRAINHLKTQLKNSGILEV